MKKMLVVLSLLSVALSGVALAASKYNSLTYYQIDSSSPPTPLSVGLPLDVAGVPIRQVTVTVSDFSDGGNLQTAISDDDYLKGFTLLAWRKVNAGQLAPARDAGYTRQPELDMTYTANAAAIASSTNPASNLQASRSWSATIAGTIVTQRCDGVNDGGTAGASNTYNSCVTTYVGNGNGRLPEYPAGSQLYYQAPANGVMGLDAGVKPFLITIDGVYN